MHMKPNGRYVVKAHHSGMPIMRYDDRDIALLVARALRRAGRMAGRHFPVTLEVR
jgi:hypothetical protein